MSRRLRPSCLAREPRSARRQAGASLIELLVGTAVGLFVTAVASTVVAGNLLGSRRLQLESRLTQDLRTASDLVARDLRRAGYWSAAASGVRFFGDAVPVSNPYADAAPASAAASSVTFRYSRDDVEDGLVDANEQFAFRLRNGAIEMQLGASNWQTISDSGTVVVSRFDVASRIEEIDLAAYCESACPASSATCPPRQLVRSFTVSIAGHATADARVQRSLTSAVRVRNDAIVGACAP